MESANRPPQSPVGMLLCFPGSHDALAAWGSTAMKCARSGMGVAIGLPMSRKFDCVAARWGREGCYSRRSERLNAAV